MNPRRITLVANELRGSLPVGGAGTATTFLALALARAGHAVEILNFGTQSTTGVDPEWARTYAEAGVSIRFASRNNGSVEPSIFEPKLDTEIALRADPPEVVIAQDGVAPAYTALRLRQLGLGFEDTLFVVFCHSTRGWIKDVSRNVRVFPGLLADTVLERASLELADAVVSPSAYMVDWMNRQGWRLPARTVVIPYLTRSAATGEPPRRLVASDDRVQRLVFFGRLDERKGVRPFVDALNAQPAELLERVELDFLGAPSAVWTPERVEASLSARAMTALRRLSFETDLDQHEALARLSRPGTLAVMPSLEDNSPNTVYECLEHGIPFIASSAGGTAELIAAEDRPRVLFEPTAEALDATLRRLLSGGEPLRAARAAFDPAGSLEAWARVVEERPRRPPRSHEQPAVDVVVVHRASQQLLSRCLAALARQRYPHFQAIVAAAGGASGVGLAETATINGGQPVVVYSESSSVETARHAGLHAGTAPFVVFLDEEDEPAEQLLETLVHAQAASGADIVSCALLLRSTERPPTRYLFLGDPGGLGLISNSYGTVALIRRSLLNELTTPWPVTGDPDWPLLARLTSSGARIVSIPAPLVTRTTRPGELHRHPSDALIVTQELERTAPEPLRSIARLAAGLAADAQTEPAAHSGGLARRARAVLRRSLARR